MNMQPSQVSIPTHLADVIREVAGEIAPGANTPDEILWTAIQKVTDLLFDTSVALYGTAAVSLRDIAQRIRAKAVFTDDRLNYILDRAYWNPENKLVVPMPKDYANWVMHRGQVEKRYEMTIRARPAFVWINGCSVSMRGDPMLPVVIPKPEDVVLPADVGVIELLEFSMDYRCDTLFPHAQLECIRFYRSNLEQAIREGRTHRVQNAN